MKAPDKKYPLSVIGDLLASTPPEEVVYMPDKIYFDGVDTSTTPRLAINEEYIRKDALMEWLEQNRNQAQMWFDRYNDREDLSAKQVWEEVIGKLNEM